MMNGVECFISYALLCWLFFVGCLFWNLINNLLCIIIWIWICFFLVQCCCLVWVVWSLWRGLSWEECFRDRWRRSRSEVPLMVVFECLGWQSDLASDLKEVYLGEALIFSESKHWSNKWSAQQQPTETDRFIRNWPSFQRSMMMRLGTRKGHYSRVSKA
jgi:hypothetical protein